MYGNGNVKVICIFITGIKQCIGLMKLLIILLCLFVVFACLTTSRSNRQENPLQGYKLVWSDEFNGNSLDRTKWMYRGLGKRGDAFNTPEAIALNGKGCLVIKAFARYDSVFAGMIATEGLFAARFGFFECRAQLTNTMGMWPAFWLQSPTNTDNSTPERDGAEIDIFEYFPHIRRDAVSHTLHWGGYKATHKVAGPVWAPLQKSNTGFHTFALAWTPESYTTFVDGVKTYSGNTLISHVSQFIILSVEANRQVAGPLNQKALPDSFVVDYVRVYKK